MSTRRISITGARDGHGASTVAAALALYGAGHQHTTLIARDARAMAALLGVAAPGTDVDEVAVTPTLSLGGSAPLAPSELVVIDDGNRLEAPHSPEAVERYVVVRGPCYLALRSLLAAPGERYDGVVLLNEPGRSLRASDVAQVLEVPVVAEIGWSAAVARAIDAGVLPGRLHHLRDLAPLRSLALTPPRVPHHRPSTTYRAPALSTPALNPAPYPTTPSSSPTPPESGTCKRLGSTGGLGPRGCM